MAWSDEFDARDYDHYMGYDRPDEPDEPEPDEPEQSKAEAEAARDTARAVRIQNEINSLITEALWPRR